MNVKQDFSTPGTHFPVMICEIPLFNIQLVIQEFVLALYFLERFLTFLKHYSTDTFQNSFLVQIKILRIL